MLIVLAAATPDLATPWWVTVLATAGPVVGVIIGALLGPLVEPWKLGAAHRAHVRKERLVQCVRLIEAANHAWVEWQILIRRIIGDFHEHSMPDAQWRTERTRLIESQRAEVRNATKMLGLYGPPSLAEKAEALIEVDMEYFRLAAQDEEVLYGLVDEIGKAYNDMNAAMDAFVEMARKCAR